MRHTRATPSLAGRPSLRLVAAAVALLVILQDRAILAEASSVEGPEVGPEVEPPAPLDQAGLDALNLEDLEKETDRRSWRAFGFTMVVHAGFTAAYLLSVGMVCAFSGVGGHDGGEMDDDCGVEAVSDFHRTPLMPLLGSGAVLAGSITSTAVMSRSQFFRSSFFAALAGGLFGLAGHFGITHAALQTESNAAAVTVSTLSFLLLPAIGETIGTRLSRERKTETRSSGGGVQQDDLEPAHEPTPALEPEILPPVPVALVAPGSGRTALGVSFGLLF